MDRSRFIPPRPEGPGPVTQRSVVQTGEDRVRVFGSLDLDEYRRLLAAVEIAARTGPRSVKLDFSKTRAAYPGPMAALCAACLRLHHEGVTTSLILPNEARLKNLFFNAGWAHLIDPARYDVSRFEGYTHVPAAQFASASEQQHLVNRLLDAVLKTANGVTRDDLAAMEWALNEITDNVLVHSKSAVGGVLHLNNFAKEKRVDVIVADPGLSIPTTLRANHPEFHSDVRALEEAIKEGVTRDKAVGQGNGLFGTFRISQESHAQFHLHSGAAQLDLRHETLKLRSVPIRYAGTLVVAGINYAEPLTLAAALSFTDKTYAPLTDHIELKYELDADGDAVRFNLARESPSFGSRTAGLPVRTQLLNLYRLTARKRIVLDFAGVPLVSSSFADEVVGKLFLELGPLEFMRAFQVENANPTVQQLVNRAILQRSRDDV